MKASAFAACVSALMFPLCAPAQTSPHRCILRNVAVSYGLPRVLETATTSSVERLDGDARGPICVAPFVRHGIFFETPLCNFAMTVLAMPDALRADRSTSRLAEHYRPAVDGGFDEVVSSVHLTPGGEWARFTVRRKDNEAGVSEMLFYRVLTEGDVLCVELGAPRGELLPSGLMKKLLPAVLEVVNGLECAPAAAVTPPAGARPAGL